MTSPSQLFMYIKRHRIIPLQLLYLFLLGTLLIACNRKIPNWKKKALGDLPPYQQYFCEIALSSEFGRKYHKVRKWTKDVTLYVEGQPSFRLESELLQILAELNELIDPIRLIRVKDKRAANIILLFGSADEYVSLERHARSRVKDNWGLVYVFPNLRGEIKRGSLFVDIYRAKQERAQRHLLREEFTQALGLLNDSWEYEESIFYQGWTTTTQYSDLDKTIIKMLYDKRIKPGMKFKKVLSILKEEDNFGKKTKEILGK